jgi:hypothetical protein
MYYIYGGFFFDKYFIFVGFLGLKDWERRNKVEEYIFNIIMVFRIMKNTKLLRIIFRQIFRDSFSCVESLKLE